MSTKSIFEISFVFIFVFLFGIPSTAQEKVKSIKYGMNYGIGKQGIFPFQSNDYTYEIQFYKFQINYTLHRKRKHSLELNIEPSIYIAEHQLLNEYFVEPKDGANYLELRKRFTQLKTIKEYTIGIGFIYRYYATDRLSIYALGSVGPLITDTETERMAKGFAFSDILSFGFSYPINSITFDIRYGVRHVSNLNFSTPNSGYNSTNIEAGFLIKL